MDDEEFYMKDIFQKNKYTKWYLQICSEPYTEDILENHHIIPKCLGGSNDTNNLVMLSPKAHFICHWLLTKMMKKEAHKQKMFYAFNFMLCKPKDLKERRYYPCSRVYQIAKKYMYQNNPNNHLGVREKISQARKKAWENPTKAMLDGIEKMRKSKIGKAPSNKGIVGVVIVSEKTKKIWSEQRVGRKWYTDGVKSYFIKPENAKPEYKPGRK